MTCAAPLPLAIGLSVARFLPRIDHDILINHDEITLYRDGRYVRLLRRLSQLEKGLASIYSIFQVANDDSELPKLISELTSCHQKSADSLFKLILRNQSVPSSTNIRFASLSFGFQVMMAAARQGRFLDEVQLRRIGLSTLEGYEQSLAAKYETIVSIAPRLDCPVLRCLAAQQLHELGRLTRYRESVK